MQATRASLPEAQGGLPPGYCTHGVRVPASGLPYVPRTPRHRVRVITLTLALTVTLTRFYWAPAIGIFLSLYCSLRQMATVYLA